MKTFDADMTTVAVGVGLSVVILLVLLGLTKIFDLKRKREDEAVVVQAQLSDALLRHPRLFNLALTPTARVSLWTSSPVMVEVTGHVPSDELRLLALDVIGREADRIGPDVRVISRIEVETPAEVRRSA